MSTIFSRIIAGEIPGRFVWTDEQCVAFLAAHPCTQGHTLVVPRLEVDSWLDADPELMAHLVRVAHAIGRAQQQEWDSVRAGLLVQGFEVPHLHVHVWAVNSPADFDVAIHDPDPAWMDEAATRLRTRLRAHGHGPSVPAEPAA